MSCNSLSLSLSLSLIKGEANTHTTRRVKHCYQEANKCAKALARKGSSQVDEFVILYGPLQTYVFYFNLKKGYGLQTYIFCLIYDLSFTNFFFLIKKMCTTSRIKIVVAPIKMSLSHILSRFFFFFTTHSVLYRQF